MSILIYLLVAGCGANILTLEIVGTRVLGPYFGVDIFILSALISTTLAALSLGYYLGGKIADEHKKPVDLAWLAIIAGILIGLIP